jgi:lipopolysaccharide export system permease protein
MAATVVLFLGRSMRYTRLLFASPSALQDLGKLFLYSLPFFLAFAIPMATLLGVLLAFTRLASDNEITALKAAGVSLYQLVPAVAIVAASSSLIALALSLLVLPRANDALKVFLADMARSRIHLALKERVFNDQFKGLVVFINRIAPDGGSLQQVFISDERDPRFRSTIIAEEGMVADTPGRRELDLRLFRGTILRVDSEKRTTQTIRFQDYDFSLDLVSSRAAAGRRAEWQLTLAELDQALEGAKPGSPEYHYLSKEWHKRFALPFACLVLGFIAAPLSLQTRAASRLSGVVLGLLLFLLYYVLFTGAETLAEGGLWHAAVAMWLPNGLFGLLASVLWVLTAREKSLPFIARGRQLMVAILARIRDRR